VDRSAACDLQKPWATVNLARSLLHSTHWFPKPPKQRSAMSHCHDEHGHHGHSHGEHDHSDDITPALQFSLYQHIDFDNITSLNESVHGSGKAITKKEWTDRLSDQPEVASDADEQLIINVP